MYFQSKLLLDAKADPNVSNAAGHAALKGLEGAKEGQDAWDNPMNILKAAEDGKIWEEWRWERASAHDFCMLALFYCNMNVYYMYHLLYIMLLLSSLLFSLLFLSVLFFHFYYYYYY
jgi:hypothetical protein